MRGSRLGAGLLLLAGLQLVARQAFVGLGGRGPAATQRRRPSLRALPEALAGEALHDAISAAPWAELAAALSPPAFAQEALLNPQEALVDPLSEVTKAAAPAVKALPKLEEGVDYLYGADGQVLRDPTSMQPLKDDWWNGFIGIQAQGIRLLDGLLRGIGVPQAFGWTIVLYTALLKVVTTPLQESSLRNMGMLAMVAPQAKNVQEKLKDQPEVVQERVLTQLYTDMNFSPTAGCLPVLLTFPIYFSLFCVWRRLFAEGFPYFQEGWLWIPCLAFPNPDFSFSFDWLFDFTAAGDPTIGWFSFGLYMVLPALLIGNSLNGLYKSVFSESAKKASGWTQYLPWISVALITFIAFELPQAVLLYYAANIFLSYAQDDYVRAGLRESIPGYTQFEKTGEFPEGAFEEMKWSLAPAAKSLQEAAMRGDVKGVEKQLDSTAEGDVGQILDAADERGRTPLGCAVAAGRLRVVELLLDRGAAADVLDQEDNTLLHYAAGYGHEEVMLRLLKTDTWPNDSWQELRNQQGQSVLDVAIVSRQLGVLEMLRTECGMEAAQKAQVEILQEQQARILKLIEANEKAAEAQAAAAAPLETDIYPQPIADSSAAPSAPAQAAPSAAAPAAAPEMVAASAAPAAVAAGAGAAKAPARARALD